MAQRHSSELSHNAIVPLRLEKDRLSCPCISVSYKFRTILNWKGRYKKAKLAVRFRPFGYISWSNSQGDLSQGCQVAREAAGVCISYVSSQPVVFMWCDVVLARQTGRVQAIFLGRTNLFRTQPSCSDCARQLLSLFLVSSVST